MKRQPRAHDAPPHRELAWRVGLWTAHLGGAFYGLHELGLLAGTTWSRRERCRQRLS
jgi:hypothetical protein